MPVHHDPLRIEQPPYRRTFGTMLPAFHDADRGVGGQDRKLNSKHAVFHAFGHSVASVSEDFGHATVLWQHLGDEARDSAFPSGLGQMFQQQLSDPAALVRILDQERHLSMITFDAVIASDRDHVLTEGDDERHSIHIVDLGETPDVAITQPGIRREEA